MRGVKLRNRNSNTFPIRKGDKVRKLPYTRNIRNTNRTQIEKEGNCKLLGYALACLATIFCTFGFLFGFQISLISSENQFEAYEAQSKKLDTDITKQVVNPPQLSNEKLRGGMHKKDERPENYEAPMKGKKAKTIQSKKIKKQEAPEDDDSELEKININDFFLATSKIRDDAWGDGIAASWAELNYPLECFPVQGPAAKMRIASPFIMTVWVYLMEHETNAKNTEERVIFSSMKSTSCSSSIDYESEQSGIKLSFATSGSSSRYLLLEYSDRRASSPCYQFKSEGHHASIPTNNWVHIGLVMNDIGTSAIQVRLYLGGKLVLDAEKAKEKEEQNLNQYQHHSQTAPLTTRIGQNFKGGKFLEGRIAMLSLWMGISKAEKKTFDSMIKASFRAGLYQDQLLTLDSSGLAKSPSLLFPFNGQAEEINLSIISPLTESVRKIPIGTIHRGIKIGKPLGGYRYLNYKFGKNKVITLNTKDKKPHQTTRVRCLHIKKAMERTWASYVKFAFGKDELKPMSETGQNSLGSLGTTIIDALDTLWLMNLKKEFHQATDWVRDYLNFDSGAVVSVSRTSMKNLGGLLSAYDLTSDMIFLQKASRLVSHLFAAFSSSPSGFPYAKTTFSNGRSSNENWLQGNIPLKDIGVMQLEFRYFAKLVNKPIYSKSATKVYDILASMKKGLFYTYIRNEINPPSFGNNILSLNSMSNYFYDTLLKVYLQGGSNELKYRRMYDSAIEEIISKLLIYEDLTYIGEIIDGKFIHRMDHTVCSFAGTLALGAYTLGLKYKKAQRDLRLGKALAYTCYQMNSRMKTGLAPETVTFSLKEGKDEISVAEGSTSHNLSPDFVESLFVLHQLTKDPIYQDWGWEVFSSIENYCRTNSAYASLADVNDPSKGLIDRLDSSFLSQTLKYHYLLQENSGDIDILKHHTLSTGGHPLRLLSIIREMRWGVNQN